jgi:hypothetical protein
MPDERGHQNGLSNAHGSPIPECGSGARFRKIRCRRQALQPSIRGNGIIQVDFSFQGRDHRSILDDQSKLAQAEVVIIPGGARFNAGESYIDRIKRTTEALYAALTK